VADFRWAAAGVKVGLLHRFVKYDRIGTNYSLRDERGTATSSGLARSRCGSPLEIRKRCNAALAQLSPEHRAVIVLKEIEDLQYQEIAKILNLSIGTVMSRIFYGRKQLQSILRPIFNQRYQSQTPATCAVDIIERNCRHLKRPETEGVSRSIELAYQITPPKLQHFRLW
jgi:hypothetical protein